MRTGTINRRKRTRKRKNRRRIRITQQGYLVFGLLVLVLMILVCLIVRCSVKQRGAQSDAQKEADGPAAAPAPSETPVPTAAPTPTPTSTPECAATGARLPTDEEAAGAVDGIIRTSRVVLRKGPGKSYDYIDYYDVGERVKVYALESDYALIKVLSDGSYGFMSAEFITKFGCLPSETSATPVPAAPAGTVMGLVNVEELSLRSVPSKKNTPLGVCTRGTLLWVRAQTGDFYDVVVASTGQRGYVFAEYVMTQASVPAAPAA